MIGRLEELELVSVSGRGARATIVLQQPDRVTVGIEEDRGEAPSPSANPDHPWPVAGERHSGGR